MDRLREQTAGAAALEVGGRAAVAVAMPLLLGAALAAGLYLLPPTSAAVALAAGIGLLGLLALAIVRYPAAVWLGFVLLGIVLVEPAPADVVFALVIAVALVTGKFEFSRTPLLITGLLALFLSLNVVSVIEAIDPNRAALFFSITAYLAIFAIWLSGFVESGRRARVVLLGYLTAAVLSAALGALALVGSFPGHEIFLLDGCCRAKGLFQDSNVYGPFLVPAALILLQEILEPRLLKLNRIAEVTLFLILCMGVLLSFSRGAWLNLVLGLVVMILVLTLRGGALRRVPALLLVVAVTAAGGVAALSLGQSAEFLEERSGIQAYDADRFDAQRTGIQLAEEYPLGVGPGQFEEISPVATHSTFVRVLSEQGVLGFVSFATLMLATLLLAARNALTGRSAFGIGSAALLGAWCGLLANSLVVDTLHWRHLWVVAALIWVASTRRLATT